MNMQTYISTFTTGFEDIIEEELVSRLPNAKVIKVYKGLVHYTFAGNYNLIKKVFFLNNTFSVLSIFKGKNLTYDYMVKNVGKQKNRFLINKGTFRVRFSRENQFSKVDKNIINNAEKKVVESSNLRVDRVNPSTEVWYILRSEDIGFYCQLLYKRIITEKELHKGELRPEFAYLMCCYAKLTKESVVCDPFCGYGSIPKQIARCCKVKKIIASDIDESKIAYVKEGNFASKFNVDVKVADAVNLKHIDDASIDAIITDPPWGYYEQITNIVNFYISSLAELKRITKKEGVLVILSARKDEFIEACSHNDLKISKQINTLVNGKKAAVFVVCNAD